MRKPMTKKLDITAIPSRIGSEYPSPFDEPCKGRDRKPLGDATGLTQFGVNLLRLPPGAWSSQRHWHTEEDEFAYIVAGELVLVTDAGEQTLRAGDCAGFKAGDPSGHHLQNRSNADAILLEVGSRNAADGVFYPDIDLQILPHIDTYTHRDGTPYEK